MDYLISQARRLPVTIRTPRALCSKKMDAGDHFRPGQKRETVQSTDACHPFEHRNPGAGALTDPVDRECVDEEGGRHLGRELSYRYPFRTGHAWQQFGVHQDTGFDTVCRRETGDVPVKLSTAGVPIPIGGNGYR